MATVAEERQFDSDEHALLTGMLVGHLMMEGIAVSVVSKGTDFTPFFDITIPDQRGVGWREHRVRIRVEGRPPAVPF